MPLFDVDYVTLSRRDRNTRTVAARDVESAIGRVMRRAGGVEAVRRAEDGALLWHIHTGHTGSARSKDVLDRRLDDDGFAVLERRTLPVWDRNALVACLSTHPQAGVYAAGGVAHVTANDRSGQSEELVAVVAFSDVFDLIRDGRLRMRPVLYQISWMYEQAAAGDADGVMLPGYTPKAFRCPNLQARACVYA